MKPKYVLKIGHLLV